VDENGIELICDEIQLNYDGQMVIAFILVNSREPPSCSSFDVRDKLLELDAVKEAHVVFGQYDLIVKAEISDSAELTKLIFDEIRANECVAGTVTLSVIP
jgi:DNA-binding Lrp family transcriptional regulator